MMWSSWIGRLGLVRLSLRRVRRLSWEWWSMQSILVKMPAVTTTFSGIISMTTSLQMLIRWTFSSWQQRLESDSRAAVSALLGQAAQDCHHTGGESRPVDLSQRASQAFLYDYGFASRYGKHIDWLVAATVKPMPSCLS